jgi:hypothetical protein
MFGREKPVKKARQAKLPVREKRDPLAEPK